nr:hypothetical protein CFP56_08790 [Quercus suber]
MKADGLIDKEKLKKQTSVSSSLIPTIAILSSKRTEAPKKAFLVGNSHKTTRLATTQPPPSTSRLRSSKKDVGAFEKDEASKNFPTPT